MSAKINCFVPFKDKAQVAETLNGLKQNELVSKIYLLSTDNNLKEYDGCNVIAIDGLNGWCCGGFAGSNALCRPLSV